jgi:hypothetical protein
MCSAENPHKSRPLLLTFTTRPPSLELSVRLKTVYTITKSPQCV